MKITDAEPHIRFVNNFCASYGHTQKERVIYDFEFMYVLNGRLTIYYGDKRYELTKSDMFYFEPNVKNHMVTYENAGLRTHCVHFDWCPCAAEDDFRAEDVYFDHVMTEELFQLIQRLKQRDTPYPNNIDLPNYMPKLAYEIFAPLFSRLYHVFLDKSDAARLKERAFFLNIISELAAIYGDKKQGAIMHPQIIRAIEYIKENYTKKLTVEGMAAYCDLSPKYFGTLFEQSTGKSMRAFINELRIAQSRRMLSGTAMSIEEISERLGYSNAFYFSNLFKMSEGCSPRHYRAIT